MENKRISTFIFPTRKDWASLIYRLRLAISLNTLIVFCTFSFRVNIPTVNPFCLTQKLLTITDIPTFSLARERETKTKVVDVLAHTKTDLIKQDLKVKAFEPTQVSHFYSSGKRPPHNFMVEIKKGCKTCSSDSESQCSVKPYRKNLHLHRGLHPRKARLWNNLYQTTRTWTSEKTNTCGPSEWTGVMDYNLPVKWMDNNSSTFLVSTAPGVSWKASQR